MENITPVETKEVSTTVQTQALAPMTPEAATAEMQRYQAYVDALLDNSDYQDIQGKQFKKKSAWRKLGMAMNVSVDKVSEHREELPNGDFAYHFDMSATHTNGRRMPGSGSCTAYEKATWKDGKWMQYNKKTNSWYEAIPNSAHNVRSTAETRATNRAISNLVAAGEVSAEEADQEVHAAQYTQPTQAAPKSRYEAPNKPTVVDGYTCIVCNSPAQHVEGISKKGKAYKGIKCTVNNKEHFFFDSSMEYKQMVENKNNVIDVEVVQETGEDIPF